MDVQGDADRRVERIRVEHRHRLDALVRGAGPHLEALLDIGTAANGDLLLVLPRPAARVTELLAVPGWPTRGEAVTLLVPIAQALERLHRAGAAHGGVGPAALLLDEDGAPALAAPIAPVLRDQVGDAAFRSAVGDDVARFRGMATAVLRGAGASGDLPDAADLGALIDALFGVAEPCPIRLRPTVRPAVVATPSRLPLSAPPTERGAPEREGRWSVGPARARAAIARAARTVRPRVWAAAGAAAALLVGAIVLLPGTGTGAESPRPHPAARTTGAARAAEGADDGQLSVPAAVQPAAAVRALLRARERCLARSDERCLAAVEAAGSPVAADDRAALVAGADAVVVDPGRLRLVSHAGATVAAESGDVLVLALHDADRWRLRDVVAETPAGQTPR